jgi:hypothetical protein
MTMYTEDVNFRMRTVFAILAVLSIILAFALQNRLPAYPWIVAPSTLMFYACLFWLFDAMLWKLPVIRLLNSGIPNLAGYWKGNLSRTVQGQQQTVTAELVIKQTWSKLELILRTPEAVSRNFLVGFTLSDPNAIQLMWVYRIDGTDPTSLLEHGKGIIELTLNRRTKEITLNGAFIESTPGEPLKLSFVRSGFWFWNPEPF